MKNLFLIFLVILTFNACKTLSKSEEGYSRKRTEIQHANIQFPENNGFVNVFNDILSPDQILALENLLEEYEQKTSHEITVVTVNSIEPYDAIQWYATDLANYWDIGENGLLILVDDNDRKIWILPGKRSEIILTDKVLKGIIDSTIIPEFKQSNFYTGIVKGVKEIITKWN